MLSNPKHQRRKLNELINLDILVSMNHERQRQVEDLSGIHKSWQHCKEGNGEEGKKEGGRGGVEGRLLKREMN